MILLGSKRGKLPGEDDQHFPMLQVKTEKCPLGFTIRDQDDQRKSVFSGKMGS